MCGIFGILTNEPSLYSTADLSRLLVRLALLSESRGKESSGFTFWNSETKEIQVVRGPIAASEMIKDPTFKEILDRSLHAKNNIPLAVIGHCRLVTNGTQLEDNNNQPVIKDGIVGVHNGIIVNVDQLWGKHPTLNRSYDIDTEVMLSLFRYHFAQLKSMKQSISKTFSEVAGTVTTAMMFEDLNKVLLATNNGSLYILSNNKDLTIFGSERYILKTLFEDHKVSSAIGATSTIQQLRANTGLIIDLLSAKTEPFEIVTDNLPYETQGDWSSGTKFRIDKTTVFEGKCNGQKNSLVNLDGISKNPKASYERKLLEYNDDAISRLKRCIKCLLPETFPFISYDDQGICNFCTNYVKKNQPKSISELQTLVEPYRNHNGNPDCIIPFSGGRDSCYSVHFVKKELGLNPITFTYDWGMVTDLARRNIARVCGKLGIENIIVSADIAWKRENIRKNITAWLKRPTLGMIPLFMAGDKYFFYYTNQIKKQTNIKLNIWGINNLENTDFKVGFAGISPKFNKRRIYSLDFISMMKLFSYVGKSFIQSPGYMNASMIDTLGSFFVRYLYPKEHYYHLYDYIVWDEKTIVDTIIKEYGWETAVDTNSTWRIGDGTASFYNYIYCTVAGFTENDTFRSNQIREGLITREKALKEIHEENMPRYETLKWYLDIVGLDYENTIGVINKIPKLYNISKS